jgi:hypothetical protein
MKVTAWSSGSGTFGIRVGKPNRDLHFRREWSSIEVQIDGKPHGIALTGGFWRNCPEFRSVIIRDWLATKGLLEWERGQPPELELSPLGGNRFRLSE